MTIGTALVSISSIAETSSPAASMQRLDSALAQAPLIAILRGLPTSGALAVVEALYDAGIRVAEVPLNSPAAFETIALLVTHFGDRMVLGAGTVTEIGQVRRLAECGALLCVSPNTDPGVIAEAVRLGLVPVPGFQTATEAFAAVAAGARHLKLFPAAGKCGELASLMAVLPRDVTVVAVGGIAPTEVAALWAAGARAYGIGSDIYRPGTAADAVRARAQVWLAHCTSMPAQAVAAPTCNPRALIGESPLWRPARQAVTWVDPVQRTLLSAQDDGRSVSALPMTESVFSIAALSTGQMVGTLENGFCSIDEASGATVHGAVAPLDAGCRFNDMTVDPAGGLWAGAMHKGLLASRGALYYAAHVDAPCVRVADGLGVPNGMAFDAAASILYVIDTLARTLLAYPADIVAGSVGEPVIVTDFLGIAGKPDGMTIAADGSLWVAMWGGACVVQIAPGGALLSTIAVAAPHVSSVAIDDAGRLWVSTSRMRLSERQLAEAPGSGALFMIDLAAAGQK